jgi:hypothetical protein
MALGSSQPVTEMCARDILLGSVSQPPGRGPVPGPGINYTGPREVNFYSGSILRRIIFVNVSKSSDPERLNNVCVANVSDQDAYC